MTVVTVSSSINVTPLDRPVAVLDRIGRKLPTALLHEPAKDAFQNFNPSLQTISDHQVSQSRNTQDEQRAGELVAGRLTTHEATVVSSP
jgi:hypothetical protein